MSSYRNVSAGKIRQACVQALEDNRNNYIEISGVKFSASYDSVMFMERAFKLKACALKKKQLEELIALTSNRDIIDTSATIMLSSEDAKLILNYLDI